jgi:hypothetical protein
MTHAMSTGRLILAPADPRAAPPSKASLLNSLDALELIGSPLDSAQDRYLAGGRFLELISFMGCSPHVELEPPPDGTDGFCHIALMGPLDRPRLLYGPYTSPPRCPACRGRLEDWRETLTSADTMLDCARCGERFPATRLVWRRTGGFARIAVEIRNIFPSEAVPVPELMTRLARDTGQDWGYFYA